MPLFTAPIGENASNSGKPTRAATRPPRPRATPTLAWRGTGASRTSMPSLRLQRVHRLPAAGSSGTPSRRTRGPAPARRPRAPAAAATSQSRANVLEAAATCSRAKGSSTVHAAHGARRQAAEEGQLGGRGHGVVPARDTRPSRPHPAISKGLANSSSAATCTTRRAQVTRKREAGRAARALIGRPFRAARPAREAWPWRGPQSPTLIAPAPVRVPARGRPRSWRTPGSRPSRLRCR